MTMTGSLKPIVLLCPMLLFIDGEDLPGTMGEVLCRGHIGEQDEAASPLPPYERQYLVWRLIAVFSL